MTYRDADIVRALVDALNAEPHGDTTRIIDTVLNIKFPLASEEQTERCMVKASHELRAQVEELAREGEQLDNLGPLFDGLPSGTTLGDAARIKAEQGDPLAIAYLGHSNSRPARVLSALTNAALDAHPDFERTERGHRWLGKGEPPADIVERTVDWFQKNHPRESRAIESSIAE